MPPFGVGFSKQRKKPGWRRDRILQFRFHATILGGLIQAAKKAGLTKVVQLRSTRFFNFPHRVETRKHPCDRILQFRFHSTILGGLIQAAEKAGLTKVVQLPSKSVFSTFPIGAKRKNTLEIEFYNFGFLPPFWADFSKQRKKPGSRRLSNCVQNAFFPLSPLGQNEKTPLGSNFTISVSCHHLGWAFPSSGKSRVDEGIEFYNFGFMPPFWVGLSKQRKKPGWRRSSNCVQRVFSTFPIGAKRKNTLGIEFYNFGFMPPFWVGFSKQRKKPGLRRSSICVQNAFFQLSPSGRNEKTPLGSNFQFWFPATILGGLFQAAEKAGFTKVVQLRSKRVFSTFPIGAKRKNTLGIEFYNFGFLPPFWADFSKQRKKPGSRRSSNCVQNAFFQLSPSGQNEKTPLGSNFTISVSWHHFGWAYPSSGKSRVDEGLPIAFKTRFFNFPHRGKTRKHPWDRILKFWFHATILGGLFQAAEKAGFTKVVQLCSKRVFSTFPIGAKRKNTLGIEFYNFGFMPPFGVGFSKQRKKPGWRRDRILQFRFHATILGGLIQAAEKAGLTKVVQFRSTRFFNFPHRGKTRKHPWDRILQFQFHGTILGGLIQAAEKAGLTKVFQLRSKRVFSTFPIGAKLENTLEIEF